jgi:hypothetical protein
MDHNLDIFADIEEHLLSLLSADNQRLLMEQASSNFPHFTLPSRGHENNLMYYDIEENY